MHVIPLCVLIGQRVSDEATGVNRAARVVVDRSSSGDTQSTCDVRTVDAAQTNDGLATQDIQTVQSDVDDFLTDDLEMLYFGRRLGVGQRDLPQLYNLSDRKFIANTSMDPLLSLLMCNLANVQTSDLVFDPFVGSGSLLVACAHHGAYVMGADIDYLLLQAKSRPSRPGQKKRDASESVEANLQQYGLASRYIDVIVTDSSRLQALCSDRLELDAVITDPPYGVREATKKSGHERGEDFTLPEQLKENHIGPRVQYCISQLYTDLLNFCAKYLRVGGILAFWLPVHKPTYSDGCVPVHPCLELRASCEQPLQTYVSRRCIVMRKARHPSPSELHAAYIPVDTFSERSFREAYFTTREEQMSKRQRELLCKSKRHQSRAKAVSGVS